MESFEYGWEKYDDTENPKGVSPRAVQDKIKLLENLIKNTEHRIETIAEKLSTFSEEDIAFYRSQEMKYLEEYKKRKFNLEHGLDEFTGKKIIPPVEPGDVDLYDHSDEINLYDEYEFEDGDADLYPKGWKK